MTKFIRIPWAWNVFITNSPGSGLEKRGAGLSAETKFDAFRQMAPGDDKGKTERNGQN